jgi:hypothetical protein
MHDELDVFEKLNAAQIGPMVALSAPHTAGDGAALRFVCHFATCPHADD